MIASGLGAELRQHLMSLAQGRSLYWIWDARVWELWKRRVSCLEWPALVPEHLVLFAASEEHKRLAAVEDLARQLIRAGADRASLFVAVGGGVTGDVVGFLASIYMRGVPHIQLPTTLLAQVDSSVGGKTGVDLPEGKNLLGTFQQASAVFIDPEFLESLPSQQFSQGMAEVIKMAMLGDEGLWRYLEENHAEIWKRDGEAMVRIISSSCRLKAQIVEADEKESGLRRYLNFGHTVGHALEKLSDYQIKHGDAVAMGMLAATRLAVRLGMISKDVLKRLVTLHKRFRLPTKIISSYPPDAILEAFKTDKKLIAGKLHFILPSRIGAVEDRQDLDLGLLGEVLRELQMH